RDISNNERVSEFSLIRLDCLQNADVHWAFNGARECKKRKSCVDQSGSTLIITCHRSKVIDAPTSRLLDGSAVQNNPGGISTRTRITGWSQTIRTNKSADVTFSF